MLDDYEPNDAQLEQIAADTDAELTRRDAKGAC
jgi:hypothetical protein